MLGSRSKNERLTTYDQILRKSEDVVIGLLIGFEDGVCHHASLNKELILSESLDKPHAGCISPSVISCTACVPSDTTTYGAHHQPKMAPLEKNSLSLLQKTKKEKVS